MGNLLFQLDFVNIKMLQRSMLMKSAFNPVMMAQIQSRDFGAGEK